MSDHTFHYDLKALDLADVYFKANLNWQVTDKVLTDAGMAMHRSKIAPFFFFADYLDRYPRSRLARSVWPARQPRYDVCHIAGVYANPVRDGQPSIFECPSEEITPTNYHFWIRYHTQKALREAGISGYYRLTSRACPELEDNRVVFPNLNRRQYMDQLWAGSLTMVNTLPHSVFPWKATESLALGRPLIMEQTPLMEMPAPLRLQKDVHYVELLPDLGGFDPRAALTDPASHRVLTRITPELLTRRAEWLKNLLADRTRVAFMQREALVYAERSLRQDVVAEYICDQVRRRVH
jgi:hypothetical protein